MTLKTLTPLEKTYREALEDMVWQFAYRITRGNRRCLTSGGLSALEGAFAVLGWNDPHYTVEGGCEIIGCHEWATSVASYPRSHGKRSVSAKMRGHGFICSGHLKEYRNTKERYAD